MAALVEGSGGLAMGLVRYGRRMSRSRAWEKTWTPRLYKWGRLTSRRTRGPDGRILGLTRVVLVLSYSLFLYLALLGPSNAMLRKGSGDLSPHLRGK